MISLPSSPRLNLPEITLCAASSVNVPATLRALEITLAQVNVAACKLFTDDKVNSSHPDITVVPISRLTSSLSYSNFILQHLVDHVETPHCLIVQWDGHVLHSHNWSADFLGYDYVGASWPQFTDGHDVGNGGFSLRSRRLMEACRDPSFRSYHPEDVAIGRVNRDWLQAQGMRFAPGSIADRFSTERAGHISKSFGYHGAWLMPSAIGVEPFWDIYRHLDDRATIRHDFSSILKQMWQGQGGWKRALKLILDQKIY
jgi:hypothetical protein